MMQTPSLSSSPSLPTAALGEPLGYRFEADTVELHADIECHATPQPGQEWALQLWAGDIVMVAELPLGPLHTDQLGRVSVSGVTTALPPAGTEAHALSLALVSGLHGSYDCLHDQREFAQLQGFAQPRMQGAVACSFSDEGVSIDIAAIENPRDAANLSGTLALELWSLDAPYGGGSWSGAPIASLVIGRLGGQSDWTGLRFAAHAATLPGSGHLTLMLREWTAAGYVTRDYRPLARPDMVAATAPASAQAAPAGDTVAAPEADTVPANAASRKSAAAKAGLVSVNQASVSEIGAIKGIGSKVAKAIVAARPYASLDELVRAKGVGPKLLKKVRGQLCL